MKETKTQFAFSFLCKRNPLDIEQSQYVAMLMAFEDIHGDEAIQALAGFYVWCIDNLKGEKCTSAILETFSHDLHGCKEKAMLPRSSSYLEFWNKECEKHYLN